MPQEYIWQKFLRYQGWTDAEVLNRQPHDEVNLAFELYRLAVQYGQSEDSM